MVYLLASCKQNYQIAWYVIVAEQLWCIYNTHVITYKGDKSKGDYT